MSYRHKLRFRVFLSYPLLGLIICAFMVLFLLFAIEAIERKFMDDVFLLEELKHFAMLSEKNPKLTYQKSKNWVIYKVGDNNIPEKMTFLLTYPPGTYDIEYQGKMYDLGVLEQGKQRYFILYDDSDFERLESNIMTILAAAAVIIMWLTTWYGLSISRKVIEPISSLASRVKLLDAENAEHNIAPDYADDEVGALALEFDAYSQRLQALIRREREFTGNASHELRTPLAVIIAASENLTLQKNQPLNIQQKVLRINRAANEMSQQLDALLALSRGFEKNDFPKDNTNLKVVIEQLINGYHDLIPAQVEVITKINASSAVDAPYAIVAMVIGNLIKNAFNYTESGTVKILLAEHFLSVTDTGKGIANTDIDQVFEHGFRTQDSRGSGFGLGIAKRICDQYGWRLELDSQINHGTCIKWFF